MVKILFLAYIVNGLCDYFRTLSADPINKPAWAVKGFGIQLVFLLVYMFFWPFVPLLMLSCGWTTETNKSISNIAWMVLFFAAIRVVITAAIGYIVLKAFS